MARIRTIKPEFPQSESMGRVSRDARLLFILLWTIVDDEGRARAASRMLASLLYPYDDDAKRHIGGWLQELSTEGCVTIYEIEGNTYVQIEKWLSHQKIDKPSKSRLPAPIAKPREASRMLAPDLGPRTMEGIKEQTLPAEAGASSVKTNLEDGFAEFHTAYKPPKNSKRPDALRAWIATTKLRPPLPDLLRAVEAYNAWLAEETRKQKRDYPKQHAATWLRGEVWNGYLAPPLDPALAAEAMDKADRYFKRGKYAENFR